MDISKKEIEAIIQQGVREETIKALKQYELNNPFDADILSMKTVFYMMNDEIDRAYEYARKGVRKLPLNGEMQYNLACVCEKLGLFFDAYICYIRAGFIFQYTGDDNLASLDPFNKADDLIKRIMTYSDKPGLSREEAQEIFDKTNAISSLSKSFCLMFDESFRVSKHELIGSWYYESLESKKYAGIFKDQYFNANENPACRDVIHEKAEFLPGTEGTSYELGTDCDEYMLPIASEEPCVYNMITDDGEYLIAQHHPYRFSYYRLPGGTRIESGSKCIYGKPIPLRFDPLKKRLIMSIFVDGLSYSVLRGEQFGENMPYTYDFFSKGTVFSNAYNSGEWTYPSIASYVTGLDTTHHMLFHNIIDYPMPEDVPTLAEYFQSAGYYTSKYCGNWRIIPPYGHARGYDRFVYQHQKVGFKVHEVISDAINQIDAGRDLNQYIWISIGDLHDIPDKVELPLSVQRNLPIKYRVYHKAGPTSVKQGYNADDVISYINTARHIDRWLHILYEYIEENYSEEEIVISLFSDHGQGFLIEREGAHFLSGERSNVPMMFRGGMAEGTGLCDETVSALDYSHIMRKLAGIADACNVATDGQLPKVFGGSDEREYAYTESIHPGDPYQAAIFSPKEGINFFFVNPSPVKDDGRFVLADYCCWLEDTNGVRVTDDIKLDYFLDITLKHIAYILIYE